MRSPIIFSNDATPAARRSYGSTSHPHVTPLFEGAFEPDMLGEGYERCTIDLGVDPDGETDIVATVVRHLHQGETIATPPLLRMNSLPPALRCCTSTG